MDIKHRRAPKLRRSLITAAIAATLAGLAGGAHAQATTGSIFGQVPAAPGETVAIQSDTGLKREVSVGADGRYVIDSLPLGTYTVSLRRDGATVDSRSGITLRVGAGTEVSFAAAASAADAKNLGAVTVTGNALPAIDVSAVDSRTVITSQQLERLPLARSAEAIALLAPGVVPTSSLFGNTDNPLGATTVSVSGSSATENAYYINGFNTTDPISNLGGLTLPYGAIDQQEVLAGGYGAAYGRSDGGVISQVGKRGTNEWHYGGQVLWTPPGLQADPINYYYVNKDGSRGRIRQDRHANKFSTTTVDAYVGGPLIKDKLFFFLAAEAQRRERNYTDSNANPTVTKQSYRDPKWYAKLDWNINDSNVLELTGASSKTSYNGNIYDFDYATRQRGGYISGDTPTKNGSDLYTGKFTSYITEDLTVTAMYGKMKSTFYSNLPNGYDPSLPYLFTPENQNPALTGGDVITNNQATAYVNLPGHKATNTNLRVDISYHLGDHTITAGIDNQTVRDRLDGQKIPDANFGGGLAYAWEYNSTTAPDSYIVGGPGTAPEGLDWQNATWVAPAANYPGGEEGYYVARYRFNNTASVRVRQRAQYIEDSWQIDDRWLVKLGLRNDQFTNYGASGKAYISQNKPQWAPRLGFAWDVFGDSSFKVYGNAGRYYLAMPASVALRSAGSSLYTREYFTYTSIDEFGVPQGLTPIDTSRGLGAPISGNSEYGQPRDPKVAASKNIKSEYQDEYILGFDKKLNEEWVFGAKATYRKLRNAIDDIADKNAIVARMNNLGIDPSTYTVDDIPGSILINPGKNNHLLIPKLAGGYYDVTMRWREDFHFNTSLKRKYYGLDLYLEHPFDGKWFARINYLWSHSFGNSEGQVRSDIGQGDVSATVDWDFAQLMDYANGNLANDRRHQIKAYGYYQVAPEWMLSGSAFIVSGSPRNCLGLFGPDQVDPAGYGGNYHYCNGEPSRPGDKHNKWTYQLDLGVEYRPEWASKKLAFNATVFNVLNKQTITQRYAISTSASYLRPYSSLAPRAIRVGVNYDF